MDTIKPVKAVIVGGGHRSMIYANYSLLHPDKLKIVGIADPDPVRRQMAKDKYGFSDDFCFESAQDLALKPRLADAVINGTMDHQHFETSVPLLKKGYDMLLEKPFAVSIQEMHDLLEVIRKHKNKVMVCHVLRYSPFYVEIKRRILNGDIGNIINIQTAEHVGFSHLSTSYVRGKWANSNICKTSMLLAKSCHDIDIMMWLMGDTKPESVSSFGSIFQFKPENAPKGSGSRCLADCPYVDSCRYSAKKIYLEHNYWDGYVWADFEGDGNLTEDKKIMSLKTDNPYGKCIYKCDNNVVDHQSVLVNFENGATGTHNMIGGSAKSMRKIHIIGTKGEISGNLEDNKFILSRIDLNTPLGYKDEVVDVSTMVTSEHNSDDALTEDFINFIKTGKQSISCTSIYNSIAGHLTVFLADMSKDQGGIPMKFNFSEF